MIITPCTEAEVSNLLLQMKKEGQIDDIPRKFLKACAHYISQILADFFNACIEQGTFPKIFKLSKITPVFKKGAKNLIKNYRPISILTNITKLFESIIFNRLQAFFKNENLLSENQYGFRKDRSTELAVFGLIFKTLPAIEHKKYAIVVFLDYSSCFDTIDRERLNEKLDRYGIRGRNLNLIKSYFESREQYVKYGESKSSNSEQS